MAKYFLTDDQFIESWKKIGSPHKFAKEHGLDVRSVYNRRRSIESRLNIKLPTLEDQRYSPLKKQRVWRLTRSEIKLLNQKNLFE